MDPKNNLIEDSASCALSINTANTNFWIQTPYDKYWKCGSVGCTSSNNLFWRTAISGTSDYTLNIDTQNDWTCPIVDNDINNQFCTPTPGNDPMYGYYTCSKIKCVH